MSEEPKKERMIFKGQTRIPCPNVGSTVMLNRNPHANSDKRKKYQGCDFTVPWKVISISKHYFYAVHPNKDRLDYYLSDGEINPNARQIPLSRYGNGAYAGVHWQPNLVDSWVKPAEMTGGQEIRQPAIPDDI